MNAGDRRHLSRFKLMETQWRGIIAHKASLSHMVCLSIAAGSASHAVGDVVNIEPEDRPGKGLSSHWQSAANRARTAVGALR